MNPHLRILSNAFYTLSAIAGLPALAGAAFFGWTVIQQNLLAPKPTPAASKDPTNVGDLIQGAADLVKGVLGILGGIADAIVIMLAIVSLCVLAFAVLLLFSGRGIRARRTWARWLGFVMMLWLGFVSFFGIFIGGRSPVGLAALLLFAGSGYAIWVLLKCFSAPMPTPTQYPAV